jgi:hypothetical protein
MLIALNGLSEGYLLQSLRKVQDVGMNGRVMYGRSIGRIRKEELLAWSQNSPRICLKVLRKAKKNVSQDNQCPKRAAPEYERGRYRSKVTRIACY